MCWLLFPSQTSLKVDYTLKKPLNHCPLSTETALGFPTLPTCHPQHLIHNGLSTFIQELPGFRDWPGLQHDDVARGVAEVFASCREQATTVINT